MAMWQWHQLDLCKSAPRYRQITPTTQLFAGRMPSCHPAKSIKALKEQKQLIFKVAKTSYNDQ